VKWILFVLGWVSFILGVIGAFLPVLPTTPFLILSAFLFSKSSPRFHAWLLSLPYAGEAIKDWDERKVINPRAKILCTAMILFSASMIWIKAPVILAIKIILNIILFSVNVFVLTRKSR
jgi:uncharacterized membrane protein YbaN (DUF454 family)